MPEYRELKPGATTSVLCAARVAGLKPKKTRSLAALARVDVVAPGSTT